VKRRFRSPRGTVVVGASGEHRFLAEQKCKVWRKYGPEQAWSVLSGVVRRGKRLADVVVDKVVAKVVDDEIVEGQVRREGV